MKDFSSLHSRIIQEICGTGEGMLSPNVFLVISCSIYIHVISHIRYQPSIEEEDTLIFTYRNIIVTGILYISHKTINVYKNVNLL